MSEAAWKYMSSLANRYVREGYPLLNAMTFAPKDDAEARIFDVLRGADKIRCLAEGIWVLTDGGLDWILETVPASVEAGELLEDLQRRYAAAGYPPRRGWSIEPDGRTPERVYNELRARGYFEQMTMEWYMFSEQAVRRMVA